MTVIEFAQTYPEYALQFSALLKTQSRVFDPAILQQLPEELTASHEYRTGGRGRPNLNQTRTHAQCSGCRRVLRNDFYYAPPSIQRRNGIFSYCKECVKAENAHQYAERADRIAERRDMIWRFLAPSCAICGFDRHPSAMDMHHLGEKEAEIATLITDLAFVPKIHRAERLLRESSRCIPLCSNCHRMLHAGAHALPPDYQRPSYTLAELLRLLRQDRESDPA